MSSYRQHYGGCTKFGRARQELSSLGRRAGWRRLGRRHGRGMRNTPSSERKPSGARDGSRPSFASGRESATKCPPEARGTVGLPVIGYVCVDAEQSDAVRQLRAHAETVARECQSRGFGLVELIPERRRLRASTLTRPGLEYALERLSAGEVKGLVVADLSQISHSVPDLGLVLDWFLRSDVRLVAASPGLDTGEEAGRLTAVTIIEVARWERERLSERTRIGMQAARLKGPRQVADFPALSERIARMREDGMTLQAIADRLNAEGVPTVRGGSKWRPSSVQTAAGYRRPTNTLEAQVKAPTIAAKRRAISTCGNEPTRQPTASPTGG
jgi:DNA invertase Pin-like site-specific DNA recombinase